MPDFGASIWLPLILGGASAASGALNNKKSARTSESTSESSSTTTRNLLPFQEGLIDPVSSYATDLMTNPAKFIEPYRQAGTQRINKSYARAPQQIADKMLAFGGSRSGKAGRAMREAEFARIGDVGNFESSLIPMILQQQNQGASLAERLLGINFGQSATEKSSGTGVAPGSAVGGGLSSGLQTLTTMLSLQKLLAGEGGG